MQKPLPHRQQSWIAAALVVLLVATRGHHFPTLGNALPGASWAVFFLAGMYVRTPVMFGVLMALAAGIDYVAITWGGVSSYCISPAYIALVPAYGVLWFAGRCYGARHDAGAIAILLLAVHVAVATLLCELISSGSFYLYSGRFGEASLSEFITRFAQYFPQSLWSMGFWIVAAGALNVIVATLRGERALSRLKR